MKKYLAITALCTFTFILWMAAGAKAQTSTGMVLGAVTDQSGAAIPTADVTLQSTTTGVKRVTQSQGGGNFEFPFVPPDIYQLIVTKGGFSPVTINNVIVRVGETYTQNVQLSLGAVTQEVTVTAQVAKVDASTAVLGAVTGYTQITILPILGRSFLALATLSAGTVANYPGNWTSTYSGSRPNMGVSISGSTDFFTTNLIDGVPTKSPEYGGIGYQLPMEMIDEFNIQRGYYSAKYPGPGVVNVVSRSGKNEIHGVAWETFRNNVLDSRSFFDQGIPPLRQNHFGGAVGGAIIKDKLFYFGNVQFVRDVVGYTERGSVPTAQERAGDLSDIKDSNGNTIVIHDLNGTAFAGAQIPTAQIDSFANKYMGLGTRVMPLPNIGGIGWGSINRSISSDELQTDNFFDARVDYNRSSKDSFFVRFGFGNSSILQPSLTSYSTSSPYDARNGVIGWTHIISPTLINEFHFGLDRVANEPILFTGPGVGTENFNQETGLVGANAYSPCDAPVTALGFPFQTPTCDISISNDYAYEDSVAYIRGKHSFQFGGELTRFEITDPIFNYVAGGLTYTGQYSGNNLSDFLLGYLQSATALTKVAIPYRRSWQTGLFAEDKYQATKDLTINFGLRYELPQPAYDKQNNLAAFVPGEGFAPNTPYCFEWAQATSAETISGQPVCPSTHGRALVRTNYHDFAPRIGLAWSPFGKKQWAFRASYGVFFDTLIFNEEVFNSLGFPVVAPYGVSGTSSTPLSPEGQFGQAGPTIGGYLLSEDPNRSDPYLQQWTLSIQRELPGSALLSVAYLGNRGTHLFIRTQYNVAHLGTTPLADRLPFPNVGAILNDKSEAQSDYNALQVDLEKRYSHNLTFRLGYTFANAMDDATSQGNSEMVPWDVQLGWQRSQFLLKHNFVLSHTYLLPFGAGQRYLGGTHGAANKVVSGWQWVGILSAHTGFPFTLGATGLSNTNTEFFGGARPNRTCSGQLSSGQSINHWFDTSCFSVAPANTFGNAGYGFLDAPGYFDWDMSGVKDTKLTEKLTLQFRAEFFNTFNRANFNAPNASVTEPVSSNPLLGVVTGAQQGRIIQGVLRFLW